MITLLASIAGFITSIIPELLKILKDRYDKKHELDILDRQLSYKSKANIDNYEEAMSNQTLAHYNALYATYKSGVGWVDALNGSVRPVLAYCFFILYSVIKIIQYKALAPNTPLFVYIDLIWSIEDQAIFAGIISFYFGQRTFSKLSKSQ